MDWQTITALVFVALAGVQAVRILWGDLAGTSSSCGTKCKQCPSQNQSNELVALDHSFKNS